MREKWCEGMNNRHRRHKETLMTCWIRFWTNQKPHNQQTEREEQDDLSLPGACLKTPKSPFLHVPKSTFFIYQATRHAICREHLLSNYWRLSWVCRKPSLADKRYPLHGMSTAKLSEAKVTQLFCSFTNEDPFQFLRPRLWNCGKRTWRARVHGSLSLRLDVEARARQ